MKLLIILNERQFARIQNFILHAELAELAMLKTIMGLMSSHALKPWQPVSLYLLMLHFEFFLAIRLHQKKPKFAYVTRRLYGRRFFLRNRLNLLNILVNLSPTIEQAGSPTSTKCHTRAKGNRPSNIQALYAHTRPDTQHSRSVNNVRPQFFNNNFITSMKQTVLMCFFPCFWLFSSFWP